VTVVAKLTLNQIRTLRAAQRGDLLHSIDGDYAWIRHGTLGEGRVTVAARKLKVDGLIEMLPRQRGDEHHGRPYRLAALGDAALSRLLDADAVPTDETKG
jgi:hypothetical protein